MTQDVRTGPKHTKSGGFEDKLLTGGRDIISSLPQAVFRDEQALNDACIYLGWLEMWNDDSKEGVGFMQDEIDVALYKINGTPAIDGRARDEGVQAHVGIFFPRHASKDDKKRLEKMQIQYRDKDSNERGEKREND